MSCVNDILNVTRIESQSLNLSKEQFDLKELLSSIVRDSQLHVERERKDKDVTLEYREDTKKNNLNVQVRVK